MEAKIDFGRFGRRVMEADFSGGALSSDGGLLQLRQVDQHLGLSRAAAAAIPNPRDPERITHSVTCSRSACTACAADTKTGTRRDKANLRRGCRSALV